MCAHLLNTNVFSQVYVCEDLRLRMYKNGLYIRHRFVGVIYLYFSRVCAYIYIYIYILHIDIGVNNLKCG